MNRFFKFNPLVDHGLQRVLKKKRSKNLFILNKGFESEPQLPQALAQVSKVSRVLLVQLYIYICRKVFFWNEIHDLTAACSHMQPPTELR